MDIIAQDEWDSLDELKKSVSSSCVEKMDSMVKRLTSKTYLLFVRTHTQKKREVRDVNRFQLLFAEDSMCLQNKFIDFWMCSKT